MTSTSHPLAAHPIVVYCREKIDDLTAVVPRAQRELLSADGILQTLLALLSPAEAEKLRECHPASVYDALMQGLRLGLDPAPGRGEYYLIPRSGVCTGQVGAQGKIALAYRSGLVTKIVCNVVYEDDDFEVDLANGLMSHTLTKERIAAAPGKVLCAYARVWTKGAPEPIDEVLRPHDFAKIKSKAGGTSGAWKDWESEMWRRSVLNRALKRAPRSVALSEALADEPFLASSTPIATASSPPVAPPTDVEERLARLRDDAPPFNGADDAGMP